eukprot:3787820-Pleurochrysis_carterae.AAC.5
MEWLTRHHRCASNLLFKQKRIGHHQGEQLPVQSNCGLNAEWGAEVRQLAITCKGQKAYSPSDPLKTLCRMRFFLAFISVPKDCVCASALAIRTARAKPPLPPLASMSGLSLSYRCPQGLLPRQRSRRQHAETVRPPRVSPSQKTQERLSISNGTMSSPAHSKPNTCAEESRYRL